MAKPKQLQFSHWLQSVLIRICRIHFALIVIYAAYTFASDATNLITPVAVANRYVITTLLAVITFTVWINAKAPQKSAHYYRFLAYALIFADIMVASFSVYNQRGMASRAVMLYAIAIATSAILLSRTVLLTTATVCAVTYGFAVIKYFQDFFNEGYRAELFIEAGLYAAVFYVLAAILGVIIRFNKPEAEAAL